jgi:hypothetical protein
MKRIRIKLENFIKISKIRGRMNPPIPLVMRITSYLIGGWNIFCVSLGPRIRGQIIFNSHWLLKDEGAVDWKEGFRNFH